MPPSTALRRAALPLALLLGLAGCLAPATSDGAPASQRPDDVAQQPTEPTPGGEPCTPFTVTPDEARLPDAFPLLLTLRFTNCERTSVTVGTGAACDAAQGLEPRMERLYGSGVYRLGLHGRNEAVAESLASCEPGERGRAVAPGETVEARLVWNGTLLTATPVCEGEGLCGTEGEKPTLREAWTPAEPDLYALWVTSRAAVANGYASNDHRAPLRLLAPEPDPDAPCARLTLEGDRRELVVGQRLDLTARLENCGREPLTLEPGGPCADNAGITVALMSRETGTQRWLVDDGGPAREPDALPCPPYVAPPHVLEPGDAVAVPFVWDGTLLDAEGASTPAAPASWLLGASARTTEGEPLDAGDATWGVELRAE